MLIKYFRISILLLLTQLSVLASDEELIFQRHEFAPAIRQNGMAGVGLSLPNDENVLVINPAGLGIKNKRFNNVACIFSGEPNYYNCDYYYDDTNIKYSVSGYTSLCFQPIKNVGGFGFDFSLLKYHGREEGLMFDPVTGSSYPSGWVDRHEQDIIISVGYAHDLSFFNLDNHAIGITGKIKNYTNSTLEEYDTSVTSFIMDIGYTGVFAKRFSLGIMGSNIHIHVNELNLPFTFSTALGFNSATTEKNKIQFFSEMQYTLQKFDDYKCFSFGDGYSEEKDFFESLISFGYEFRIDNKFTIRNGIKGIIKHLKYYDVERTLALTYGWGYQFNDHIDIHFYHMLFHSMKDVKYRLGLSLAFLQLFK